VVRRDMFAELAKIEQLLQINVSYWVLGNGSSSGVFMVFRAHLGLDISNRAQDLAMKRSLQYLLSASILLCLFLHRLKFDIQLCKYLQKLLLLAVSQSRLA
jgi:hypothetical protein